MAEEKQKKQGCLPSRLAIEPDPVHTKHDISGPRALRSRQKATFQHGTSDRVECISDHVGATGFEN